MKKNQSQPFLAYYSMALCHDVTDDIGKPVPYGSRGRYDNFKEMAEMMDTEIGRLVSAIDDLGIRDNTLMLFTTDNGTAGRSKLSAVDDSGKKFVYENVVSTMNGRKIPGGKGKLTDWGTRVPTIANWPGVIKPGQSWDDLVDFSDILDTLELGGMIRGEVHHGSGWGVILDYAFMDLSDDINGFVGIVTGADVRQGVLEGLVSYRYATEPATVDMPTLINEKSSERVMRSRYGRTTSADSVMPTKRLAPAARLSAPEVPMVRESTAASASTTRCTSPRW